jgi:glycogen synthase
LLVPFVAPTVAAVSVQGGLVYSNAVTTVSPTYANEVLNGGQAGWLRSTLLRPEVKSKVIALQQQR